MENRYQELAKKWLDNTITPAEQAEFAAWYNSDQDRPVNIPLAFAENEEALRQRILNKINRDIKKKPEPALTLVPAWLKVAASILLLSVIYMRYYANTKRPVKPLAATNRKPQLKNDVKPGGNKAILTLANGSQINLNDVKNGLLASQGQTLLKKDKDGQLSYHHTGTSPKDSATIYNMVTTPKGGQFQLVLSDGSKVWLNSASSITFPTAFAKNERRVTITGEAYFEIAKNKHLPFRVVSGKQTVEVLGTHFNINAYTDETAIKTTLIEGSVKISAYNQTALLVPEQQSSILYNAPGRINITKVDTEDILAWTNGNFQFEKAEIPFIMRESARWYDVNVKYEGELPKRHFSGSISRNVNLSELLKMLKYTGINFKIEGKTIIVTS
ncbi:FecR family protein [Mucilaginibacter xinganensis]|uniref:FecR family protein n=1 Tax=Mucilaginibacter xinganensis TaxID=1234841 RepID=A0A223NXB1_9SPHI|nr:FecR family protein [Mucilaginibacter xinganensis]ASU34466.1 hypothetical protein MuYL_2579 [Mucilaginibacter xinganensis]